MTQAELTDLMAKKFYPEIRTPALREGRKEGRKEGRSEGRLLEAAESILTTLKERNIPVPADIRKQIRSCSDLDTMHGWFKRALNATSATDVTAA
jgi:hypothetical protein